MRVTTLFSLVAAVAVSPAWSQSPSTPGETSGAPLAPLVVTGFDPATGAMDLSYQTGCGTADNNIYFGLLGSVSSLDWRGAVCGIGRKGSYEAFNPGTGSYFFVLVGNDGAKEGSYGIMRLPGNNLLQRTPWPFNPCNVTQDLSNVCVPAVQGTVCASSLGCGSRQICVAGATASPECACQNPFTGAWCEQCAPGYAGPDCRECAPGNVSNALQNATGSDLPEDLTDPGDFRCEPDVPGSCAGRTCSGHGTCVVSARDAICGCDPGYAGADCEQCAPNYERDALGRCVLAGACREAKCGGHGDCVAAAFGEFTCSCDRGFSGADCGGPDFAIRATGERLSLYDGESMALQPHGGSGPLTWQLLHGPARIDPCGTADPNCPPGGAKLTIVAPSGGIPDLMNVQVALSDNTGQNAAMNFAALPSSYLPFTGEVKLELYPFYTAMLKYMRARGIRAGVLGISKGGTVIGLNGYGYRDAGIDGDPFVNAGEGPGPLVQPLSPFRLASVSKPFAAAAVRQTAAGLGVDITSNAPIHRAATWIQESINFSLTAGAPPFDYNLPAPFTTDSRWANVTIQHLINHHAGFFRDVVPASTTGQPAYNTPSMPFTVDMNDPSGLQQAKSGSSSDISYATSYALAALQLQIDPRITVARMIRFAAGMQLHYNPGGSTAGGDEYSNLGYIMLGRVLEGLSGMPYNADEPGVPVGWGPYPKLLQDYLCETSGIESGLYPGNAFQPQALEPYYRNVNWQGNEARAWNIAEGNDKIRWNVAAQQFEFCQADCPDGPGAVWNDDRNTPEAYGGFWLAERNSAGGLVATAAALLKFARNHRVKVGSNGDGANGAGSLLAVPGSYGNGSSHNGSLPGTRSWLWQMGGSRTNQVPFDTMAWNDDPSAPLDLDPNGAVLIDEATLGFNCSLPSDVAVAVVFNQRQDRRAPESNVSQQSTSSNSTAYGRIIDYLGDAACEVAAQGWPALADPQAQVQALPVCN